jgi:hypothetical protein
MRSAAAAYASPVSTDVAAYEDLPGHHLLAVRNLIATTNDESYHDSASELPPTTSHGYAEWDFSSVPDPVCSSGSSMSRTTSSTTPTPPALVAMIPHESASWSPSATWSTA